MGGREFIIFFFSWAHLASDLKLFFSYKKRKFLKNPESLEGFKQFFKKRNKTFLKFFQKIKKSGGEKKKTSKKK